MIGHIFPIAGRSRPFVSASTSPGPNFLVHRIYRLRQSGRTRLLHDPRHSNRATASSEMVNKIEIASAAPADDSSKAAPPAADKSSKPINDIGPVDSTEVVNDRSGSDPVDPTNEFIESAPDVGDAKVLESAVNGPSLGAINADVEKDVPSLELEPSTGDAKIDRCTEISTMSVFSKSNERKRKTSPAVVGTEPEEGAQDHRYERVQISTSSPGSAFTRAVEVAVERGEPIGIVPNMTEEVEGDDE